MRPDIIMFQKLDAISKLKADQDNGKTLDKNQLDKIATEDKLLEDLAQIVL